MTSRRALILAIVGAGVACPRARALATVAAGKSSKAHARYQDHPRDVRSCGTCSYFEPPKGCTVIEGEVSANGFCDLYMLLD